MEISDLAREEESLKENEFVLTLSALVYFTVIHRHGNRPVHGEYDFCASAFRQKSFLSG